MDNLMNKQTLTDNCQLSSVRIEGTNICKAFKRWKNNGTPLFKTAPDVKLLFQPQLAWILHLIKHDLRCLISRFLQ